jgi:hypothetical protein
MGNESCSRVIFPSFSPKKLKRKKKKTRDKIVASEYQQWCDFQDLS